MTKADDERQTRRAKGTGSIYQRKSDNMWCAQIELPSPDPTKRRRKVIVRAKKGDVITARRKALEDLARAGDLPTASPTVAQWADLWWKRYGMKRLKVSTRSTYQSKIEQYIKPAIGKVRLDRLTVEHVYRLHDYILEPPPAGKGLEPNTAMGAHRVLSVMVSDAEKEGRVGRNVVKLADKPRVGHKRVEYLDNAQARALLLASAGDPSEAARWTTALLTGMRQAERLGITVDELDFDRDTITVAWQLRRLAFEHGCGPREGAAWPCERKRGGNCPRRRLDVPVDQEVVHVDGGLYLTRPKSRAGWREIPMVGLLRETLLRYTEAHPPGLSGLVFTRDGGRPLDPSADSADWDAALRRAGLPDVKGHSARHTCNTILTELGVPVDVRRQILGHASNAINEAVYTHTSDTRVAEAMRKLDAAMRPAVEAAGEAEEAEQAG